MGRWAPLLALLVTAAAFTGCLGAANPLDEACPAPELTVLHAESDDGTLPRAPGEPVSLLYWATNPARDTAALTAGPLPSPAGAMDPQDPTAHPESAIRHEVGPGNTSFGGFAVPTEDGDQRLVLQVELAPAGTGTLDCTGPSAATRERALAVPATRPTGEPGVGVHVYTAGFWPNGTLFYTNMERVQENEAIPHPEGGQLGQWEGGDPLPVYIYDEEPEEEPRRYEEAGFVPTIEGFNEALKGIAVDVPRIVYIEPEEAYTREDRRDHALYGDALIFYIEATEVEEVPCTIPEPVCDVPKAPEPPALGEAR